MVIYTELRSDRKRLLALTGLTVPEFEHLLPAFARAYDRRYPPDRTMTGRPRQRSAGAGRKAVLAGPGQKLLFLLVYLKTYPLHVVLAELFGLSPSRVNAWLHRLLPVLREALHDLGVLPERDPRAFARAPARPPGRTGRIIDGTERRRQRPKNPEKQRAHYSGRKKAHSDNNVIVADADSRRIDFLSRTYEGHVSDKAIADQEDIAYPPGTVLYKDSGFQGYEPPVAQTCQAKKKATRRGAHGGRETHQPEVGAYPGARRARAVRGETLPHRQRRFAEHGSRRFRFGHGGSLWVTQPAGRKAPATKENLTKPNEKLISENVYYQGPARRPAGRPRNRLAHAGWGSV
jgi:Helix-turn-helix of DDE superfamily endonuclease/DDE superfamily endonuclease